MTKEGGATSQAIECTNHDWQDFYTGPKRTHIICANCGHKEEGISLPALLERLARAERALINGGYADLGGQGWKPPVGKPPKFIEVSQPVPAGWRLIPWVPTHEMLNALAGTKWAALNLSKQQAEMRAYDAMLNAAPRPWNVLEGE